MKSSPAARAGSSIAHKRRGLIRSLNVRYPQRRRKTRTWRKVRVGSFAWAQRVRFRGIADAGDRNARSPPWWYVTTSSRTFFRRLDAGAPTANLSRCQLKCPRPSWSYVVRVSG